MSSSRQNTLVRRYVASLPERGNQIDSETTIESVADAIGVSADDLSRFRDGVDGAISQKLVNGFAKQLGAGAPSFGSDAEPAHDPSDGWYGKMVRRAKDRNDLYDQYDIIDETRGEASSALDAWQDLMINGSVGEDSRYKGGFEPAPHHGTGEDRRRMLDQIANNVNTNLMPNQMKLTAARDMMKYGNCYGELLIDLAGGRWDMVSVEPRSAREIFPHRDDKGKLDLSRAWKQIPVGATDPIAHFPIWSIVPFQNLVDWGGVEGRSIFWSGRRAWVQVEALEASLIVRRLERASQRLKHVIDVGHLTDEAAIKKEIEAYRKLHRKVRTVDGNRNYQIQRITPPAGEDVIVPRRDKDSPADVEVLEGDATIGEMEDFNHHWAKWLATLGPPKAHLGYEGDTMRSVVTDLHVVFARKVRRGQMRFIHGLNHLYWVGMMLRGIDPRSIRYAIFPPSLGTRDELVRAQVQQMHATTVKYLADAFGVTGKQPSVRWMLQYIMGLDPEVIEALEEDNVVAKPKGKASTNKNPPKEAAMMAAAAIQSDSVMEGSAALEFLLEERQLAMRGAGAWTQYERQMTPPFSASQMGEVCRLLGVRELRAA